MREDILKGSGPERTLEKLPQHAAAREVDQVIDLTDTSSTDLDRNSTEAAVADAEASRQGSAKDGGRSGRSVPDDFPEVQDAGQLPVRSPGMAFSDDYASSPKIVATDDATGIKSALSDYDRGRRAASPEEPDESVDSDDHEWRSTEEKL